MYEEIKNWCELRIDLLVEGKRSRGGTKEESCLQESIGLNCSRNILTERGKVYKLN